MGLAFVGSGSCRLCVEGRGQRWLTRRRRAGWVCMKESKDGEGENSEREDKVQIEWNPSDGDAKLRMKGPDGEEKVVDLEESKIFDFLVGATSDDPLDRLNRWYWYESRRAKLKSQMRDLKEMRKDSEEDMRELKDSLRELQLLTGYEFVKGENDDFTILTYALFTLLVGVPIGLAFWVSYELGQVISYYPFGMDGF